MPQLMGLLYTFFQKKSMPIKYYYKPTSSHLCHRPMPVAKIEQHRRYDKRYDESIAESIVGIQFKDRSKHIAYADYHRHDTEVDGVITVILSCLAILEVAVKDNARTPAEVDAEQRDQCRDDNAPHAKIPAQSNIQHQVGERLCNRTPSLLPPKTGRIDKQGTDISHLQHIEVQHEEYGHAKRQHHILTHPDLHERLIEQQQENRAPSGQQHVEEVDAPHILIILFRIVEHDAVTDASNDSSREDGKERRHTGNHIVVVVVDTRDDQPNKRCQADAVQRIARCPADAVNHHASHLDLDIAHNLGCDLSRAMKLRIIAAHHIGNQEIIEQSSQRHHDEIRIITLHEVDHCNLRDSLHDLHQRHDIAHEVCPLECIGDGRLVDEEPITDDCIDQVQPIDHIEIYPIRHIAVNQLRQERDQAKPCQQDHRTNDAVNPAVQIQQRADSCSVIARNRLVHMIDDDAADAQLSQAQHLQDTSKEAIEAQILRTQDIDEHRPIDERHCKRDEPVQQAEYHVSLRICRAIQFHRLHLPKGIANPCERVVRRGNRKEVP